MAQKKILYELWYTEEPCKPFTRYAIPYIIVYFMNQQKKLHLVIINPCFLSNQNYFLRQFWDTLYKSIDAIISLFQKFETITDECTFRFVYVNIYFIAMYHYV